MRLSSTHRSTRPTRSRLGVLATSATVAALAAAALAGCSSSPSDAATSGSGVSIVATTNAWGSVAQAVAGDDATVTSIITDPAQDPHSFEGSARVQLELSRADIVIVNGGGYDDWATTLLDSAGSKAKIITVADVSGYDQHPTDGEFNEHLWYDFPTVAKVADTIAQDLGTADASHAADYTANAATFGDAVTTLEQREATLKTSVAGAGAAITEPVPLYMLDASGYTNVTPAAFSEAIEEGTDVSPTVLEQTLAIFTSHEATVLVYNEQTSGPETEKVLQAAKDAGIPVVPVTETMPQGDTWVSWMTANLDALESSAS